MSVSSRNLAKSLVKLIKERPQDAEIIMDEFMDFLGKNRLLGNADIILRHLENLKKNDTRDETLTITAAHEVSPELLQFIHSKLQVEKDAPTVTTLDKQSVGGITAEYRGKILDASLDTIINRLTHQLTE